MTGPHKRYAEYRHLMIARYGQFRLDRRWIRADPTDEGSQLSCALVFEIDSSTEFDMGFTIGSNDYAEATRSVLIQSIEHWLQVYRQLLRRGNVIAVARYLRRVGSAGGGHEVAPGGWHDRTSRPCDNPMIELTEAVPLVEAALQDLLKVQTEKRNSE